MTQVFGSGTLSSSDGQRFPMRGKSLTARHLSHYFVDEGISTYTHVSDQHSTYGTKIIVAPTGKPTTCSTRSSVTPPTRTGSPWSTSR